MYPVSCIPYRVSRIVYPVSCIPYPVSCIPYPVSRIVYPVSCIPYPVSCIPYPVSLVCMPCLEEIRALPFFYFKTREGIKGYCKEGKKLCIPFFERKQGRDTRIYGYLVSCVVSLLVSFYLSIFLSSL